MDLMIVEVNFLKKLILLNNKINSNSIIDNSDEAPSLCSALTCDLTKKFQCDNKRCIPRFQICDGIDNCGDGSDENNHTLCGTRIKPCDPNTQYTCANKKCIERTQTCDFSGNFLKV